MSTLIRLIVIVGAGGFGRAVLEALSSQPDIRVVGFLDDRFPDVAWVDELPVLGSSIGFATLPAGVVAAALAIGNNAARERLAQLALGAGLQLQTVVHPRAMVASNARLADGVIVMAGAVLGAGVQVGRGCIVNYGAILDHDGLLQDFARVGAGSCLGSAVTLGRRAWVHDAVVVQAGSRMIDDQEACLAHREAAA